MVKHERFMSTFYNNARKLTIYVPRYDKAVSATLLSIFTVVPS